ncbi:MAG TPA: hypothetical protein DEV93_13785 [Chloroflexi bacterium]|nr:hypothetical protein [Chloroflexota bacterium]
MARTAWTQDLEVYSEYGQFQIGDRKSLLAFEWDAEALQRHLAVAADVISVATTTMYGNVAVRIEGWEAKPPLDLSPFDQVVEASLEVPTGLLSLTSVSSNIKLATQLTPGWFRIRVASQNLANGAGGVATRRGDDRYLVQLWPEVERLPSVLKKWAGWPDASPPSQPVTDIPKTDFV